MVTQPRLETSDLADRVSLLEETGSLADVRFYRCVDSTSGIEYEAARWDFGFHSADSVGAVLDGLRRCQKLDFEGVQRTIAFSTSDDDLLVVSELLHGRDAVRTGQGGAPLTTERAFHLALELSRIVVHLHSAGVPVTILPIVSVAEIPKRGTVLRYPWLLAALSDMLLDSDDAWPELRASMPPEVAAGRPPTARAGVYAIAYLILLVLDGNESGRDGSIARLPLPPPFERVLKRAALDTVRKRHRDTRDFAADLESARPVNRSEFSPSRRVTIERRRESVGLDRPRLRLPERPVPESARPKVRPWMVGAVSMVGIIAFLSILPRISNPLTPLEERIDEVRSIFSVGRPSRSGNQPVTSSVVIPGQPFEIPDFRGRQQAEAQIQAEAMGLEIEIDEDFASDAPAGAVIRQAPDPGAVVTQDYRVTLYVNQGEANAFLVSVLGETAGEAREILSGLGFLVLEVPVFDEVRPPGEVVGQVPPGDQVLAKGQQIVLDVSRGPERIVIPTLVGLSEAGAVQRATDAGLSLRSEFETEAPAGFPAGAVYSQEPGAGSLAEPEVEIVIRVYRPEPVSVPRVIGMDPDEAFALLIASGLTVSSVLERESASATQRTVVDQIPPSGIKVARESSIRLIVERPAASPVPSPIATP